MPFENSPLTTALLAFILTLGAVGCSFPSQSNSSASPSPMSRSLDAVEPSPTSIHVIREVEVSAFYSSPCEMDGWSQTNRLREESESIARLPPALDWTPNGSRIMFGEFRGGVLRLVDSDGASLRQVADVGYPTNRFPKYKEDSMSYGLDVHISPDGSRFVYTSCEYATEKSFTPSRERANYPDYRNNPDRYDYEVAVSDMDGSNRIRLTHNNDILDHYPAWSPDESRIAFISAKKEWLRQSHGEIAPPNLYMMDYDGSNVKKLSEARLHPPKWSPDGERIAFIGESRENPDSLALITITTDGLRLKAREVAVDVTGAPSWSPDGQRLAYAAAYGGEHERAIFSKPFSDVPGVTVINGVVIRRYVHSDLSLYTAAVDGSDVREIVPLANLSVDEVSWSPRGSEFLVMGSARGSVYGVVIGNDGTKLHEFDKGYAKWSPDGDRIAVVWHRGAMRDEPEQGEVLLYTIAPDGSDRRDLVIASQDYERLPKAANPR